MKKILLVSIIFVTLVLPLMPILADTSTEITSPTQCIMKRDVNINDASCNCAKGESVDVAKCGMCCVMNSIYNVTDWTFLILVGIAVIMVLYGAFQLLTGGGNDTKVTAGRKYIIFAAVGLVAAFLAKAIPGVVKVVVGLQ